MGDFAKQLISAQIVAMGGFKGGAEGAVAPPFFLYFQNVTIFTGKNNRFLFLAILGYLKNIRKTLRFGRGRQVPIRELVWEFPGWDLSHFAKFGSFIGIL